MKNFSSLVFVSLLVCLNASAQVYTQGDITLAVTTPNSWYEHSNCKTIANVFYEITIENSFIGDTCLIKQIFSPTPMTTAVNTTGQSPWQVTAVIPIVVYDSDLDSGYGSYVLGPHKIICGPDTVFNVTTTFNTFVSDPCDYSTISGSVFVDNDGDCVLTAGDNPLMFVPLTISETLNSPTQSQWLSGTSTDATGYFNGVEVQETWMTSITVSLPALYQFIFPSAGCSQPSYTFDSLPQANIHFALQCTNELDVLSDAQSPQNARPNIPFYLHPYVNNTGCDPAYGQLKLVLDPNVFYTDSLSVNAADAVIGDTLIWYYGNLSNLSNGSYWNSFLASVHLTPDSSVNIGDSLCFQTFSDIPVNDIDPANNVSFLCIPVVNSYDPNIKEVQPRGIGANGNISPTTTELTYTIHFQNTGNAPAYTVSIIDTFDSNLDPSSLHILGTSHAMTPEWLSQNVIRFNFYNINLPDSNTNEPASHGSLTFTIKFDNVLPIGTQIENTAHIYFDSNPAIVTNTTLNTIGLPDGIDNTALDVIASVFPNPAEEKLFVSFSFVPAEGYRMSVKNCLGQSYRNVRVTDFVNEIDTKNLPAGLYGVYITDISSGKTQVKKVMIR